MSPDQVEGLCAQIAALSAQVGGLDSKVDAVHLSLEKDILQLRTDLQKQGDAHNHRISDNEKRLYRMQGAGSALALGLPFIAVALQSLIQ